MNAHEHTARGLSRREALRSLGGGLGLGLGLGFPGLNGILAPGRQDDFPSGPHHAPRAQRVIFLCMAGGPSHVDTFDHKPALVRDDGKSVSGINRAGARLLASPWSFAQHGDSGLWISELFPHLGKHADQLCLLHGMHTDVPAHAQAFVRMHTGSFQFVRPSLGAWMLYGLGSVNRNLPGFVTLNPPSGQGGAQNYGSAFLPSQVQGLRIGIERESRFLRRDEDRESVADIANPRLGARAQRRQLDLVKTLNDDYVKRGNADANAVRGVAESYELAFRMQEELPQLLDITSEKEATLARYGIGAEGTDGFGRQCLLALRLAQAGVRVIEVNQGGWDHHRNLREDLPASCLAIDQPIAALLADLARTGMLDDTLVLWSGEFGRTPHAQNGDGRDHNNRGFTSWMAGGGVRGGHEHGMTDEHGREAVDGRVSTHDWHATILHLLGLDHERLTYPYAGRDFRLTDVHGRVVDEVLA